MIVPRKPPAPKPIPWKKLTIKQRFGRNVLRLKAFAIVSRSKFKDMQGATSNLSSLASLLIRLGARQSNNALGEFMALYGAYKRFYKSGIGRYMLTRLDHALHKGGALADITSVVGKHAYKTLSYYRLGLVTMPAMFNSIRVPLVNYVKAETDTFNRNKKFVYSVKFHSRHNCRCTPPPKSPLTVVNHKLIGAQCHKWFAYDKNPWCYVHKGCKGAQKSQTGMYYAVC